MNEREELENNEQLANNVGEGSAIIDIGKLEKKKEIVIEVERVENINTAKVKEVSLRIDFKGETIAESEYTTVSETGECIFNVSGAIRAEELSSEFIDDILAHPVVFTVLDRTATQNPEKEWSPESKKDSKRNSKKLMSRASLSVKSPGKSSVTEAISVIGVCNLDLGLLVRGKKFLKEIIIVELESNNYGQHIVSWQKLPRLFATASSGDEELIPARENKLNNIIDITVESIYNAPRNIEEGTSFDARILIPSFGDKMDLMTFPNGILTNSRDHESNKRWLTLSQMEGRGALTKYKLNANPCDINFNEEIHDMERSLRAAGSRIRWNKWRSFFMVKTGANFFFEKLTKCRVWPIEIAVGSSASSKKPTKGEKRVKTASVTSSPVTEHYVAYLRLGTLLYPGVKRTRVASRLYTYSSSDILEKCGSEFVYQNPMSNDLAKSKAGDKTKPSGKDYEEKTEFAGSPVCNEDGEPVFIVVEVELWKPYILKREPEYFYERFSSYFPPRGQTSKKQMNLTLARRNFSETIEKISFSISECYRNYILDNKSKKASNSTEDSFYRHLSHEGLSQKLKLTLENKMVDLIGEGYGYFGKEKDKITGVFVDLVNKMHEITNKFTMYANKSMQSTQVEADDLQLSAEEAIENGNFPLARRYLLQKLYTNKLNPDYWLDYAHYLNVLEDYEKCTEAIREALSLDMEHQLGLLMYGLVMTKMSEFHVAELAFQVMLARYPNFIEGWMVLHLFYSAIGNSEGADYTFHMARELECKEKEKRHSCEEESKEDENSTASSTDEQERQSYTYLAEGKYGFASFSKGRSVCDPLSWTVSLGNAGNIRMKTVVLLLRLRFFEFAESALTHEKCPEKQGDTLEYLYYTAVSHYLRGQYVEALSHLLIAVEKFGKNCYLWALAGHCYYKLENYDMCINCFEYVIESYNRPNDIHLIYLRMGIYYMKVEKYKCAKKMFLCVCKYSPSSETWLGLGIACYNLEEYGEAETALIEANFLDEACPVVWAYLTLLNIQLERYDIVELCLAEVKKRHLKDEKLKRQIETMMEVHRLKS